MASIYVSNCLKTEHNTIGGMLGLGAASDGKPRIDLDVALIGNWNGIRRSQSWANRRGAVQDPISMTSACVEQLVKRRGISKIYVATPGVPPSTVTTLGGCRSGCSKAGCWSPAGITLTLARADLN